MLAVTTEKHTYLLVSRVAFPRCWHYRKQFFLFGGEIFVYP